MAVDVVDAGTVTAPAVLATAVLVAVTPAVVDTDDARNDDSAAEGLADPAHDASPTSMSGNRIRRQRIQNGNRSLNGKKGAVRSFTESCST
jgi:hypothetical protein